MQLARRGEGQSTLASELPVRRSRGGGGSTLNTQLSTLNSQLSTARLLNHFFKLRTEYIHHHRE